MGPVSQLRSLVRPLRVRDYRLLWSAQVASELGDWATRLALMLLVYHRTHSAALSAAVVTVSLIPWVGLGQVVTTAVDHLPRRTVMIGADLGRAAVFGILVLPLPIGAVFAGAFLAGLGTAPFEAARHAVRVEVTDDERLYGGAITLFNITYQLTTMAGFALGGALVALVGAHVTFAINSASFVISACLVMGIRTTSAGRSPETTRRAQLSGAIRLLYGDAVLRWCSLLSLTSAFAGMGIEAISAAYGHGHPRQVTLLAVAVPVGTVVAYTIAPHTGGTRRLLRAAGLIPLVGGTLGLIAFGLGPGIVFGVLGFAASGLAVAVPAPAGPVVALRLGSELRAPAFSVLQGTTLGCTAAGAGVGGVLAGIFGARTTCVAACLALALVGLAASARLPDPAAPNVDRAVPSAA
jgi:MFS family permease